MKKQSCHRGVFNYKLRYDFTLSIYQCIFFLHERFKG